MTEDEDERRRWPLSLCGWMRKEAKIDGQQTQQSNNNIMSHRPCRRRPVALFSLATASLAIMFLTFSLLILLETSLVSNPPLSLQHVVNDSHLETIVRSDNVVINQNSSHVSGDVETLHHEYDDSKNSHRRLQLTMTERVTQAKVDDNSNQQHDNINNSNSIRNSNILNGKFTTERGVIVNMLRRARDKVDEKDVPFLLQIPHTNSDVMYNIMTECYGIVGREYWDLRELEKAREENVVDSFYVSSHDRPKEVSCIVMIILYA